MKFRRFYKHFLLTLPIAITAFDTLGYVARVDGISMQPSLNPEKEVDYVFLNRWASRSYQFERGDVVAIISPKYPDQKLIKRIVGIQGDIVDTVGYKIPYVSIPEGYCWVEGDHTGHSYDSNSFGPISLGLITARASAIVWPPSRWQILPSYLPKHRKPINLKSS